VAKKPSPKSSENLSFEAALEELEQLVERMERGDTPLEESLKDFERGIELTRTCQESLRSAEQKVQILLEKRGKEELAPFQPDEE